MLHGLLSVVGRVSDGCLLRHILCRWYMRSHYLWPCLWLHGVLLHLYAPLGGVKIWPGCTGVEPQDEAGGGNS